MALGIGHADQLAHRVIGVADDSLEGVNHPYQTISGIIGKTSDLSVGIRHMDRVAVGVVGNAGTITKRIGETGNAVEHIIRQDQAVAVGIGLARQPPDCIIGELHRMP